MTRVRLSNKSYSAEAADVVAAALKKMTAVTEVFQGWGVTDNLSS